MIEEKTIYILILAISLFPVVIKKELQELHWVSLTLFFSILVFVFILFLQLCILGTNEFAKKPDELSTATHINGWISV